MEIGCTCENLRRRWNAEAKRCETCGCRNIACGMSASPQGVTCCRAIVHNSDHISRDGDVIRAPRDYQGR